MKMIIFLVGQSVGVSMDFSWIPIYELGYVIINWG